jgi:hypothetical protein
MATGDDLSEARAPKQERQERQNDCSSKAVPIEGFSAARLSQARAIGGGAVTEKAWQAAIERSAG